MSLLPITLYGDKILRKKVNPVEDVDLKTVELIKNMFDTMHNANGVGLAANQVGADKSIFIIDVSKVEGHEGTKPMIFINPEITERSEKLCTIEEGCLSIPDIRVDVDRPESVTINYMDTDLKSHTLKAKDILARVIQHEYDHVQGILFIDRIDEGIRKKIKKDLNKIKRRKMDFEYPITENVDYQLM
jgi:peptide deformylase